MMLPPLPRSGVFMDYARRSTHRPVSVEEELAMLIYNYHAVFTARDIVMEPSYDGAPCSRSACRADSADQALGWEERRAHALCRVSVLSAHQGSRKAPCR